MTPSSPVEWRELCARLGVAEVARLFGISTRSVHRYVRGQKPVVGLAERRADLLIEERAKRVEVYARRAAQGLPLFASARCA